MTIHLKTVEYPFNFDSTVVAGTITRTLGPITITLPETTNRTFKSVFAIVTESSNRTTAGTNTTAPVVGVQLAAVAFQDTTISTDGNGQDYNSMTQFELASDMTSYFVTNFGAGTTQTCSVRVTFPESTVNVSIKLVITYTYDDVDTTQVKTVRIPLAGGTGVLSTSLAEIGSTEVPNLSTFLPESSVTFTRVWFEVVCTCRKASASTFTFGLALDAESSVEDGTHQVGGATTGDLYVYRRTWPRDDMTTSATHAFKAKSTVAGTIYDLCVLLCVTYTFDASASTTILNSLMIPGCTEGISAKSHVNIGPQLRANLDKFEFRIEETNPVLVQSAVRWQTLQKDTGAPTALKFRVGTQTYQSYTNPASTPFTCWTNNSWQQRCDSGSAQGAGLTITRGLNTVFSDFFADNGDASDEIHATFVPMMYLNYTSDKHSSGVGVHNKTVRWLAQPQTNPTYTNASPSWTSAQAIYLMSGSTVPETNWCMTAGFGSMLHLSRFLPHILVRRIAGEMGSTGSIGWLLVDSCHIIDTNFSDCVVSNPYRLWQRYSNDPDTNRIQPFVTRDYHISILMGNTGPSLSLEWLFSYHSITSLATGSIRGYTGTGAGIQVNCYDATTHALLYTGSTSAGGSYSITGFDNSSLVFTEARQDITHLARSDNFYMT